MNKIQKVLLVIPNAPSGEDSCKYIYYTNEDVEKKHQPPLGILYIAAVLEKEGYDVEIIDNFSKKIPTAELVEEIIQKKPDILGFSVFITSYITAGKMMAQIKAGHPQISIVVGGPYASLYPEEIIEDEYVDYVVIGEGEYSLVEIIKNIEADKTEEAIAGVYHKHEQKKIYGPPREFIKNLDELPFPAWHLVNIDDYYRNKNLYLNNPPIDFIASSRGCPYSCGFCSSQYLWKNKYRSRSAKNVCDEIEFMTKNYGTRGIYFREDNFTVSRQKVLKFCEEIKKRNIRITWQCESRVNTLDDELLKEMYSAGCRGIWFGLESGSQEILDKLNKEIKLEQIRECVSLCKNNKIITGGAFMFGLPIETKQDIQQTFNFAKSLPLDYVFFNKYIGFPKCELYDYAKKNHYYKEEWGKMLVIETPELSAEDLNKMQKWFNNYFRLRRVWRLIRTKSIKQYPQMARRGIRIFSGLLFKRAGLLN